MPEEPVFCSTVQQPRPPETRAFCKHAGAAEKPDYVLGSAEDLL